MANAPKQKPFINIPGITTAKSVEMRCRGKGDSLQFRMFVQGREVKLDDSSEWMNSSWFGLVIRELDRLNWHYSTDEQSDLLIMSWKK